MESNNLIYIPKTKAFHFIKHLSFILFFMLPSTYISYSQELSFMTYNIRLDLASDSPNQWSNRRDFLANQIKFYEPGILGIQEGMPHQVVWMDSVLTRYSYTGVGRDDGKAAGEFSAIFYHKEIFGLETGSTFWLSETPAMASIGWDAAIKRICTWAIFRHLKTGKKLLVMNTHFDHIGVKARTESVRLILQKMNEINQDNLPVILMGDFNLEPDSEPIKLLTTEMDDSRSIAPLIFGPEGTFNGFHHDKPLKTRIDYIFIKRKDFEVQKYAVLRDSENCRYPSDHLPVFVLMKFR